jgi:dipeptidase E
MMGTKRLLLLSNSLQHGRGFLDHAQSEIRSFLAGARTVAFVPYAAHDLDAYETRVKETFATMGLELTSVHRDANALERTDAIFVGGGNTFRLL